MDEKVVHEKDNERFIIYFEDNEAFVEYRLKNNEIDLFHTHTEPALRGKGLAAQVVRAAFKYAKENNLKVIPTCSYVQTFVLRHSEYKELVAE